MSLSIILATRGRPAVLAETIRRTMENVALDLTRMVVVVDDDDQKTKDAIEALDEDDTRVRYRVQPRALSLGEKYNSGLSVAPADVYLVMVDYAPHVTPGFDQKILDAASIYSDGYAVVYNRNANLSFPGINAVTRKMVAAMGGIYPALYPYWFVDHHLDDIAEITGRIVFADVAIDTSTRDSHLVQTKTNWTQGMRETWFWALLFDACAGERHEIARNIIMAEDFEETADRKRALINNIPRIAYHSQLVNSNARQMLGDDRSSDEWYAQVRANGMDKLRSIASVATMRQVEQVEKQYPIGIGVAA